jgi:Pentapeptide repeats (8 copies)
MANGEHLTQLMQGVEVWNQWREAHCDIMPALRGIDFARLHIPWANLRGADLVEAQLTGADLTGVQLCGADLAGADLSRAKLLGAELHGVDLSGADLHRANLERARLVQTKFEGANLTGCKIYGISAWDINLIGAQQADLVITPANEPVITVDNLEVAQFIYLLLHNEKIREVIDTITSKAVLILRRFTPKRKVVLNAMREELRRRNYLPIVFDFEKPTTRNFMETISTLAHIARFVIADITDAKSLPQELQRIVSDLPSVPVQPILQGSAKEYGMFPDFKSDPWVLETYQYKSLKEIITTLVEKVIAPAERRAKELKK